MITIPPPYAEPWYAPIGRATLVAAFQAARGRIDSGEDEFICHALNHYTRDYYHPACKLVRRRLFASGNSTYGGWYIDTNGEWPSDERTCRLEWLDSLIQEFSQ